jgi:hypothetical protein
MALISSPPTVKDLVCLFVCCLYGDYIITFQPSFSLVHYFVWLSNVQYTPLLVGHTNFARSERVFQVKRGQPSARTSFKLAIGQRRKLVYLKTKLIIAHKWVKQILVGIHPFYIDFPLKFNILIYTWIYTNIKLVCDIITILYKFFNYNVVSV